MCNQQKPKKIKNKRSVDKDPTQSLKQEIFIVTPSKGNDEWVAEVKHTKDADFESNLPEIETNDSLVKDQATSIYENIVPSISSNPLSLHEATTLVSVTVEEETTSSATLLNTEKLLETTQAAKEQTFDHTGQITVQIAESATILTTIVKSTST